MPDLATAAPAAAPAAPAPSAPSPAPAPAAPPSAPAPAAPAPAAPPAPAQPDTRSINDRLADGLKKAREKVATDLGDEAPVEEPPAANPAAAPEVPAEPAAEEPPAEEPPAEEPPAAEPAAAELAIDDSEGWTAESLLELDKTLADHPQRAEILSALRRDGENRDLRALFPTTEAAQQAAKGYGLYQNLDNRFLSATTKEGAEGFLNEWVNQALITDDQGKPVLENGQYKFHPALLHTLNHIFDNRLSVLEEEASSSGNERLKAAVDAIREVIGGPPSPAEGEIPEELQGLAGSLKAREKAISDREEAQSRQQREEAQRSNQQAIERVETQVNDTIFAQLQPRLAKSGLSKFEQQAALELFGNQMQETLDHHPTYNSLRASILAQPPSEKRDAALRKHDLTYMQEQFGRITQHVIRLAKGGAIERQTAKQTRVAGQEHTSRTEPRGTSVTAPRAQPGTPAQLRQQIVADYKAANSGAEPDADFVRNEMFKRSTIPQLKG